jgi:mono/diheme cytochrome c family protein
MTSERCQTLAVLRRRLVALAVGLPVLMAAAVACGDDDGGSSGSGSPSAGSGGTSDAIARGQELARTKGCSACHGADGDGGLGPAWAGALGSTVTLTDGTQVVVDEAYLIRSIKDPQAQIVTGYAVAMPPQQFTDQEVADLVAYITSLTPPSG